MRASFLLLFCVVLLAAAAFANEASDAEDKQIEELNGAVDRVKRFSSVWNRRNTSSRRNGGGWKRRNVWNRRQGGGWKRRQGGSWNRRQGGGWNRRQGGGWNRRQGGGWKRRNVWKRRN